MCLYLAVNVKFDSILKLLDGLIITTSYSTSNSQSTAVAKSFNKQFAKFSTIILTLSSRHQLTLLLHYKRIVNSK